MVIYSSLIKIKVVYSGFIGPALLLNVRLTMCYICLVQYEGVIMQVLTSLFINVPNITSRKFINFFFRFAKTDSEENHFL